MESTFGPGTTLLGKYRVESVVGRGGMGIVLRVTHLHLGEELAIKVLLPDGAPSMDMATRFLREAQAAARLRGEHIARVIDVGVLLEGMPYMVMEYLYGGDLAHHLEHRRTLPVGEVVDYVLQACEALAEAHAHGIVHRDVKPANLFLTARPDGTPMVKVLDFGISKTPVANHALTRTDVVMGTAGYMSPEQMKASKDVDARTDIWALGVVLYECLCGRPPFVGESFAAVVLMAGTEPPPAMDPRIPRKLQQAVLRCLEKDRKARFPSIVELVIEIAPFARDLRAATTIVERTTSMLRGAHRQDATPIPVPGYRSGPQMIPVVTGHDRLEPSTINERGQLIPTTARSPGRRVAVVGAIALGGATALTAIFATHSQAPDRVRPIATLASPAPIEPLVVAIPDAAVVVEALPQPAPLPAFTPAPSVAVASPTSGAACAELQAHHQWRGLMECAGILDRQGEHKQAQRLKTIASAESRNAQMSADLAAAVRAGQLKQALATLQALPHDSVYFAEADRAFNTANDTNRTQATQVINDLLERRDCGSLKGYIVEQLTAETGTDEIIAMAQAASLKCTAGSPSTDQAASPPTQADLCARVDDLVDQAANQYYHGFPQAGLSLIVSALACKSEVRLFRIAALYACAAHNATAAKLYFAKIPAAYQPAIEQKCQQEHTDLGLSPQ